MSATPAKPQDEWREIRCECHRLLMKVKGLAEIETICPRCSKKIIWPDLSKVVLLPPTKVVPVSVTSTSGMQA